MQLLNGESPVQDTKFVNFLQSAGGYSYSKFAVIFPPYEIWQKESTPLPDARLLGSANVKYVISSYPLSAKNFSEIKKADHFYIYQNLLAKPRFYFSDSNELVKIERYSPNSIEIAFNKSQNTQALIFSEKYYPGWFVYMNQLKYKVDFEPPIFMKITVPQNTNRLELKYQPESFTKGKALTFFTIALIFLYFLKQQQNGRNSNT